MDSELKILQKSLYRARLMRNMGTGACSLPREILVLIFEQLQCIWLPRREYSGFDPAAPNFSFCSGWMTVTHVCSSWREVSRVYIVLTYSLRADVRVQVALSVPTLWSKPTLEVLDIPHKYIPDILIRSRSATLALAVICPCDSTRTRQDAGLNAWFTPAILRHARCLDIVADIALATYLEPRFPPSYAMNSLHELDVANYETGSIPVLPLPLRNLPEVTSLILWNYQIPWRTPLLSSKLTVLHIAYEDIGPRLQYDDFRELLSQLQSLEVLELSELAPHFGTATSQQPAISLSPSLRRLTIKAYPSDIAADALRFMSLMHAPPRCTRSYAVMGLENMLQPDMALIDESLRRLLPLLSGENRDDMEPQHCQITQNSLRLVSPTFPLQSTSSPSQHPQLERATAHFTMRPDNVPARVWHLANYISCITVDRLETLSLDALTTSMISSCDLWPHFQRASGVRRIGLLKDTTPYNYSELFNALREPQVPDDGDKTHVLFPDLELLALPLTDDETTHSDMLVSLIDLLHARQEGSTPIHELMIPEETGHWAAWSALRAIVKLTLIDYPNFQSPVIPNYVSL